MLDGILTGLTAVLTPGNLLLVVGGCFAGTIIGMLPGLGPITAIALMIPLSYAFEPTSGMIMMAGVYYGAVFGGSTSSILINAPGVAGTVATAFDGYPLARQGQAAKALAIAAYASFTGGTVGALLLLLAASSLAALAFTFQSAEYFALMLLGLTSVAAFAGRGQVLTAIASTVVGVMLSTVGTDRASGVERFTFGRLDLVDGIGFVLLAMATFALAEALVLLLSPRDEAPARVTRAAWRLSKAELIELAPVVGRSSVLGFLVGVLPGAGATIASFLAYGLERNLAPAEERQRFGHGSLRGLAAPEAANNAACSGSFLPLLTLGIPGSGTTAVLLGVLLAYGIQPGPRLLETEPEVFWGLIVSMYIGNIVLLVLNLPLIPYLAKLLDLPRTALVPLVLFLGMTGVYLISFNVFDIYLMTFFALAAFTLRWLQFPMAPMLLGFILGGMLEENLRRALLVAGDSYAFLWERPVTMALLIITAAILAFPSVRELIGRLRHS